jgi:hypothetical protein
MIYLSKTNRKVTEKYIDFFHKGIKNSSIVPTNEILLKKDIDSVCFFGILRGTNLIWDFCKKNNIDFFYMDRPYWGESRTSPYWLRIVKNNHVKNFLEQRPDDRFKNSYTGDIKPYHKNGKKILICPPTEAISLFFNCSDWLDKTLKIIKENTDKEIIIRDKPYNPSAFFGQDRIIHTGGNTTMIDKERIDWKDIHAVVTFNSSITIKALINGVPVFTDQNNCAFPVAENDFSKIETPKYEDPRPLLYSLAYGQFRAEELSNGTAWKILNGR